MLQMIDVKQGSPEWFDLRALRMTGSHAQAIAANGNGLISYIYEMMSDYFSFAEKVSYSSKAMEDGIRREAAADMVYEYTTGKTTETVGFVIRDENIGVSPDRLVGKYGMTEIKCPTDKVFFRYLVDRQINSGYEWQMQMQMMICNRDWCDYVVYNPNYKLDIIIQRVNADPEKFAQLEQGFISGEKEMKRIYEFYMEKAPEDYPEPLLINESKLEIDL